MLILFSGKTSKVSVCYISGNDYLWNFFKIPALNRHRQDIGMKSFRTLYFLSVVALFVFVAACSNQKQDKVVNEWYPVETEHSVFVFYYPDANLSDSLQIAWGEEFFIRQDSATALFSSIRHMADSLGISYKSLAKRRFYITSPNGISTHFSLDKMKIPWGVLWVEKGKLPVLLNEISAKLDVLSILGIQKTKIAPPVIVIQSLPSKPKHIISKKDSLPPRKFESIESLINRITTGVQYDNAADSIELRNSSSKATEINRIDQGSWFAVKMDNDIFNNTDVHYTNGVLFEYTAPFWQKSPISALLHPYQGSSVSYYGVSLMQTMYTPLYPTWEGIQWGDRPFASYLYIGHYKVSHDARRNLKLKTELDLGVIGKSALGSAIQSYLHGAAKRPVGWEFQIRDDIVANYNIELEKRLLSGGRHSLDLLSSLQAGTLFTNTAAGLRYEYSRREEYLRSGFPDGDKRQSFQQILNFLGYHFFISAEGAAIAYDATLQGGMFNHSSPYTIPDADVKRLVMRGKAGFGFSFRRYYFGYTQYILSPEFKNQRWHKWGRLTLILGF